MSYKSLKKEPEEPVKWLMGVETEDGGELGIHSRGVISKDDYIRLYQCLGAFVGASGQKENSLVLKNIATLATNKGKHE